MLGRKGKGRLKIGVIFTGGTIGSKLNQEGYISACNTDEYLLLNQYKQQYKEVPVFVTGKPYTILSENLTGKELEQLISFIRNFVKREKPDGIVITHGTDTLHYTAAVLSYVFEKVSIPIVLVSANYILEDSRSNGLINFHYALQFIQGKYGSGVFVSYCNTNGQPRIHRGTRLHGGLYYSDDVFSIEDCYFGEFRKANSDAETKTFFQKENSIVEKNAGKNRWFTEESTVRLKELLPGEIMQIHPFVGMKYPKLTRNTKVILHGSYHSGTIGMSEDLKNFCITAKNIGVPIYLVGLSSKTTHYETIGGYEKCGLIPLYDTTFIAQYCKLWLCISNSSDMESIMKRDIACDHCK